MLKKDITYEDFNGNTCTETFYFNLSEPELIDMEVEVKGGLTTVLEKMIAEKNPMELIGFFKKIVLQAYGQKSEDGKKFIKNDAIREEFSQSAAYNVLFMELATDDDKAADFIIGALPKDLANKVNAEKLKEATAEALNTTMPSPPST